MLPSQPRKNRLLQLLLLTAMGSTASVFAADRPRKLSIEKLTQQPAGEDQEQGFVATLQSSMVRESSGIAASCRHEDVLWTHNDSVNHANLYAFTTGGKFLASYRLRDAAAIDWEDIASFTWQDQPYLLVGDIGNNNREVRHALRLYLIREPDAKQTSTTGPSLPVDRTLNVRFAYQTEDQPAVSDNFEALAIDPHDRTLLLAQQTFQASCQIYAINWPQSDTVHDCLARPIATLDMGSVTSMDISADGRQLVVCSYTEARLWSRDARQDWQDVLQKPGREVSLPAAGDLREAVCFSRDQRSFFVTVDRQNKGATPLFRTPVPPGATVSQRRQ